VNYSPHLLVLLSSPPCPALYISLFLLFPPSKQVLYHPVYAKDELKKVKVVRYDVQTFGDKFASGLVKLFRKGFDIVTGYKHVDIKLALQEAERKGKKDMSLAEMRKAGLVMTPEQWLAVSGFC
jgi:ubiquinol oxidase